MLSIQPINFNFIRSNNIQKNNLISAKLKPLACDTISFSGARNLNHGLLEAFQNQSVCEAVHNNVEPHENHLRKTLRDTFGNMIATKENSDGILLSIKTRRKTPESIREKATSVFEEAILNNDKEKMVNLNSVSGIKSLVNDVVGARIILGQTDTKANSEVINKLIKLIEKDKIKIIEAELIIQDKTRNTNPYFSDEDIQKLEHAINNQRLRNNEKLIKVDKKSSRTGYGALHLNIDLIDPRVPNESSGYKGEIQIMGPDVAHFKDLEDYCYKVKQNKDIKAGHPAYVPFAKFLNKYLRDENGNENQEHIKLFNEYTYKAYILQRKKDPKAPDYDRNKLPTLSECDMKGKIPKQYDFNHLQKIKNCCDTLYNLIKI